MGNILKRNRFQLPAAVYDHCKKQNVSEITVSGDARFIPLHVVRNDTLRIVSFELWCSKVLFYDDNKLTVINGITVYIGNELCLQDADAVYSYLSRCEQNQLSVELLAKNINSAWHCYCIKIV